MNRNRGLPATHRLLDLCVRCYHPAITHEDNYGPAPCFRIWECWCPAFVKPTYLLGAVWKPTYLLEAA